MTAGIRKLDFTLTIPSDMRLHDRGHPSLIIPSPEKGVSSKNPSMGKVTRLSNPLDESELESLKTFVEILFKKTSTVAEPPLLTAGATSTEDEIANISYLIRTLMSESPSAQAIGVTTGENVFQGFWAAVKSMDRFIQAKNIQDRGGMIEGGLDAFRGVSQSIGGGAYLGYRGAMIAADVKGVDTSMHATTSLGQSAFILGFIGNIAFLIFYIMIGFWSSYSLIEDFKFSLGMKAHENNTGQLFDFLMRKVTADPKVKLQKLNSYWKKLPSEKMEEQVTAFRKNLADTALSQLTSHFLAWQEELIKTGELTGKPLTKEQTKKVFEALFAMKEAELRKKNIHAAYAAALGLDKQDLDNFNFSTIELIGFKLENARSQAKKEAKFSRATNDECMEAVKKQVKGGLSERLKCSSDALVQGSALKELNELQGKVVAENTKNKKIHSALIVIAVLGIVASILGFMVLSPAGAIALTVVTLLLVVIMMATDGCSMLEGWKNGGMPGQYDKAYIIIISLVIIAALGVGIGVTLGFGLPLLPLILSCGIGGVSLGLGAVAYYKLTQKEKAWIEDHPNLQRFKNSLDLVTAQDSDMDDRVTALFKKLSQEDRVAIRKKYNEMSAKGGCGFKQSKYKALDRHADFGNMYIWDATSRDQLVDEKQYQLMLVAMKKSVKCFWEKWEQTKSAVDCQRALKLQSLFESVKQRQLQDVRVKLNEITHDHDAYKRLKNDVWYVVKRQESAADLKQVIEAVIQERASSLPVSAQENRNKVSPLIHKLITL